MHFCVDITTRPMPFRFNTANELPSELWEKFTKPASDKAKIILIGTSMPRHLDDAMVQIPCSLLFHSKQRHQLW